MQTRRHGPEIRHGAAGVAAEQQALAVGRAAQEKDILMELIFLDLKMILMKILLKLTLILTL